MNQFKIFHLPLILLAVAFTFVSAGEARDAKDSVSSVVSNCLFYVGTYTGAKSKGIYLCRMNLTNGALTPLGLAAETPNPAFLALEPRGRFLYAANEIGNFAGKPEGAVTAYAIEAGSGKLTLLNQRSSAGAGPCHIILDRMGRNALVANYGNGSLAVLPIQTDGQLANATTYLQFEGKSINPDRQEKPHTHCLTLDAANRFAFACDLGIDKIMAYRFDPIHGKLTPNEPPFVSVKPGSGPRHLTFRPDGRFAYLLNELSSTIVVFAYEPRHGVLKEDQTISTLNPDFAGKSAAAEIAVHPSGKFLYASNRGDDSIAVFAIDAKKGTLNFVQRQSTLGKTPRYFGLAPNGKFLIAANQDSGTLVVFTIEPATGQLADTGHKLEISAPGCLQFLPGISK